MIYKERVGWLKETKCTQAHMYTMYAHLHIYCIFSVILWFSCKALESLQKVEAQRQIEGMNISPHTSPL